MVVVVSAVVVLVWPALQVDARKNVFLQIRDKTFCDGILFINITPSQYPLFNPDIQLLLFVFLKKLLYSLAKKNSFGHLEFLGDIV